MINIYSTGKDILYTSKKDIASVKVIKIAVEGEHIDNEWIEYISGNKQSLVFHHPHWIRLLEKETNHEVIRLTARNVSGKIIGVLPLQVTSGMYFGIGGLAGSSRISSLPRTPLAGILADETEVAEKLLAAAIELTAHYPGTKLQIKTLDPGLYNNNLTQIIPWRENFAITLPAREEDIKFGSPRNHRRIKWAVNKASGEGVRIRKAESISDLKRWYELYLDTSRWHAVPPRSYDFFRGMFTEMNQDLVSLLFAEKDNKILAGSFFLMYNNTVFYSFNGRDKNMLSLRPNDLIQHEAIYKACREGYSHYDMGEVSGGQEGLSEFKKKWGCDNRQIYHVYYSSHPLEEELLSEAPGNLRLNIWRNIPLGITAKLGKLINNRL